MATTNDSQLTDFLNYFNNTRITPNFTAAQKAAEVMKFFSVDTPNPNPSVFTAQRSSRSMRLSHHSHPLSQLPKGQVGRPWVRGKATTTARQHLRFSLLMGRSRV
jgi:hypothetical protein